MNIHKEASKILDYYRNSFMKEEQYTVPYQINGTEVLKAWQLQDDDIAPKLDYYTRNALELIMDDRIRLSNRRQMVRLIEKECIEPINQWVAPFTDDSKLFVHQGRCYPIPNFNPQGDKFKGGVNRAEFIKQRIKTMERQFEHHFINPRVWATAVTIDYNSSELPSLGRLHKTDPYTWDPLRLYVRAGWNNMQQLSTSKHLFAGRIHSKCQDEILDDDVRVCDVWAWDKKDIRDFYAARSQRPREGEDAPETCVPLVPLVLAYNYTSSSLVSNRSRAIQSIKKKTKNRVATSLWG